VLALAGITALVAYAAAGWLRRRRPTA
jgi:hypothetical protein